MAYEKQTFVDNSTVLKAEHLNHIEDGISVLSDELEELKQNGGGITDEDVAEIVEEVMGAIPEYTGQVSYTGEVEVS